MQMKKVNFKKLTNQFLAGVFGLALMGGVMLHTQDVEARQLEQNPTLEKEAEIDHGCTGEQRVCCANGQINHA